MPTLPFLLVAVLILSSCDRGEGAGSQVAAASAAPAGAAPAAAANDELVARADRGRIRGDSSSKIWLIVASDFECPYCKLWHDSTDATLRREYIDNGKVRLAFMNFPLRQHPHALPAAEAAMCASAQGKFWEMHDAIFASQDRWKSTRDATAIFESLAGDVGVDVPALRQCVASHRMRPMIQADYDKGVAAGVNATPFFFVGNERLSGAQPASAFRRILDAALSAAAAPPGR